MKNLSVYMALLLCLTAGQTAKASLVMTGVMDGTLTGGEPKVVELYATADIADLSRYAISRGSNGAATFDAFTANFILPNVALSAGSYYYAVGNSFVDQTAVFDSIFPGRSRALNHGVNSNGNDVTGLFFDASGLFTGGQSLVDVFGVLGVDGAGTAWDHLDSWAYRVNGTTASAVFNQANWTVAPINSLDPPNNTPAAIAAAVPFGTFTAVPEPSSLALLGLVSVGGFAIRRRRRAS